MPAKKRTSDSGFAAARALSPRRNTTRATTVRGLVAEQLEHFSIDPRSTFGRDLARVAEYIYEAHAGVHDLWSQTVAVLGRLDRSDRIAYFNAKRFLCFQLAKVLDSLQHPLRKGYQSLIDNRMSRAPKGPYPIFDNVTALFSATPVISRTATYLYACTEWIDDAFRGKELLHEIYSRMLNSTSVSLANHIVDLEAGDLAGEYMAWNFNSGMAAVDATIGHVVGHRDIILSSRNIYGGVYQLLHDWYAKPSNLDVAVEWFDGYTADVFEIALARTSREHAKRLADGRQIFVYLESPCNPHGYVLDVPGICRRAHAAGLTVICDATIGTPMLQPVLQRDDPLERPDFVIHSYTKDLAGSGATTAGVCIARNERMFIPKGESVTARGPDGAPRTYRWDETLFWNVYYVKGAFLDADKAFEVISGMRTLSLRMLQKCINTIVLARALDAHPHINVKCSALESDPNAPLRERLMFLGLPAPLFTLDFEGAARAADAIDRETFKRFFDCLEPAFGLQVSLGQVNTVVLCPALTSHSELPDEALAAAGITPTTIRIAVGDEDPRELLAHFIRASALALNPVAPGFSKHFPEPASIDALYRSVHLDVHERYLRAQPPMEALLE